MNRTKHRSQRATSPGEWIEPGATRKPAAKPSQRRRPALEEVDLATHLDLVATIGLLHSLFAAQPQND